LYPQVPRIKAAAPSGEDTLAAVTSVVQSVLGFTPTPDQPLMEAGLDSLGAVELRNGLATRFGASDLPATLIFDYATTAALAGFIAGTLAPPIPLPWCLSRPSSRAQTQPCLGLHVRYFIMFVLKLQRV